MPELPEVQTILNAISPFLMGKQVVIKPLSNTLRTVVELPLIKGTVHSLKRRGKAIILKVGDHYALLHFGFGLMRQSATDDYQQHRHDLLLIVAGKHSFTLHDRRRFGFYHLLKSDPTPILDSKWGVEPLTAEFNSQYLYDATRNRRIPIKKLLMEAKVVTGIGNIYANEVCFQCKLNPLHPACQINLAMADNLVAASKQILKKAIELKGTTVQDYLTPDGKKGKNYQLCKVYRRQSCGACGAKISSSKATGQTTYYCPVCQI